jgi:hypothetical protein
MASPPSSAVSAEASALLSICCPHTRSSASAMPPSPKAFFSHLQPQLSPVFPPKLLPTFSRCELFFFSWQPMGQLSSLSALYRFSFLLLQAKPSASMLLAASKHALRFFPYRGVSDAIFGLYMLYWFRCFERMMGPRKCVQITTLICCTAFVYLPNSFLISDGALQVLFFSCSFCLAIW